MCSKARGYVDIERERVYGTKGNLYKRGGASLASKQAATPVLAPAGTDNGAASIRGPHVVKRVGAHPGGDPGAEPSLGPNLGASLEYPGGLVPCIGALRQSQNVVAACDDQRSRHT